VLGPVRGCRGVALADTAPGVQVWLWDLATGQVLQTLRAGSARIGGLACFTSSANGRLCVAAAGGRAPGSLTIWETGSGTVLREWELDSGAAGAVAVCSGLPDGDLLLVAEFEGRGTGTVAVFDTQTGALVRKLEGFHTHTVRHLSVLERPDGPPLALTQEVCDGAGASKATIVSFWFQVI
jgi:WD40 repeat protein